MSDHEQWDQHYQAYFRAVLHYVRRLVGSDWLASSEDLAQEAFAVAYANRHQFGGRSSLSTWICGIALNVVRQHLAREAFANRMLKLFAETDFIPQSSLSDDPLLIQVRRERATVLLSVVENLPEKLLQVFVTCCIFGVSQEDAAIQLGISEGNLRVRLTRAKALIKQRVSDLDAQT
ncbi:MAG TPA: RNA polymerase sigma factor [Polyangiaceae bacterium]|nr:RNA polymerase sigma factor [Polyangiaceae bacterium]